MANPTTPTDEFVQEIVQNINTIREEIRAIESPLFLSKITLLKAAFFSLLPVGAFLLGAAVVVLIDKPDTSDEDFLIQVLALCFVIYIGVKARRGATSNSSCDHHSQRDICFFCLFDSTRTMDSTYLRSHRPYRTGCDCHHCASL